MLEARYIIDKWHKKISYIAIFLFVIFDISFIVYGGMISNFDIWFIFTSWFLIIFFLLQILYILLSPLFYITTIMIILLMKKS